MKLDKHSRISLIFKRLQAANKQPTTELIYHTPFELLIAVILSAQATDKSVNKVTEKLFKVANTPAQILKLGQENLENAIKSIGLYKNKAKNIYLTAQKILQEYNGHVPDNMEMLIDLPGVGRKTANVILNTLYKKPVIAVDTHVLRVSNRLQLARGDNPQVVERTLMHVVPEEYRLHAHHWLILHGRYVCTARNPKCGECVLQDLCPVGSRCSSKS